MLCKWTKAPACHVTLELHKWLHLVVELETESESESGKEGEPLSVDSERSRYSELAKLKRVSKVFRQRKHTSLFSVFWFRIV